MQNPFSGFLQPPTQSSPLAGAPEFAMALSERQRQFGLDQQRKLENDQQFGLAQRGATRADSQLKLEQDDQAHRFTADEQKQVEGLLAEYQDAEDQNDGSPGAQVRLSRVSQMLKRFGMDVGQKGAMDPRAEAFTGAKPKPLPGQLLPQVATRDPRAEAFTGAKSPDGMDPRAQAFTGGNSSQPGPIDEADAAQEDFERNLTHGYAAEGEGDPIQAELESREKLRQRMDKSGPDIAGHLASVGPLKPLKLNTPDQQEASAKRLPNGEDVPERPLGDVDMDIDEEAAKAPTLPGQLPKVATVEAPQVASAQQSPPRLPGQLLPTVISKGGKQLYESTGPSGRWAPMVSGVFEPFTQHDNPEMAAAAKRAQAFAQRSVTVDGPEKAIKAGMDYLQGEANRISQTERTKIGSKAHVAGAAAGGAFNPKLRQFYTSEMHESLQKFKNENIEAGMRGYDAGLSAINSSNPASQYDAINQLLAARSGKTVSDRERAIYDNLAGVWAGLTKKFDMAAGQQMPSEYRSQIRQLLSEAKNAVVQAREERARAAEAYHASKLRGAKPEDIQADSKAVGEAIRMGATAETSQDNSDL